MTTWILETDYSKCPTLEASVYPSLVWSESYFCSMSFCACSWRLVPTVFHHLRADRDNIPWCKDGENFILLWGYLFASFCKWIWPALTLTLLSSPVPHTSSYSCTVWYSRGATWVGSSESLLERDVKPGRLLHLHCWVLRTQTWEFPLLRIPMWNTILEGSVCFWDVYFHGKSLASH